MAEIRSLKLALLADTKQFIEGLDKADKETRSFSNKLGDALKKGALAFAAVGAAAGAMAIKIGVDAVKAAIEDQQSQESLAKALKNTTKATDAQVKATEEYITKAQNATGVTDTKLRSALGNLVRATNDVTKAQKLNNLALDVAFATGNDLEAVSLALSKAYNGNLGALTRLGIPLDANIIKTKDFDAATEVLAKTFGGAAAANAETFAGKIEIIKRRLEDAQETIGYAILPILERFAGFINQSVVPAVESFVSALTGKQRKSLVPSLGMFEEKSNVAEDAGYDLGTALRNMGEQLGFVSGKFDSATNPESSFVQFVGLMTTVVDAITKVIEQLQKLKDLYDRLPDFGKFLINPAPDLFRLAQTATTIPSTVRGGGTTVVVNNNIKTAVDPQATARAITKVTNTATKTTGIKPFVFGFR
jgi:hypothetical protein